MSVFIRNVGRCVFKSLRGFGNDISKYTSYCKINSINRTTVTILNLRNCLSNYRTNITSEKTFYSERNDYFSKSSTLFISAGILNFFGLKKDEEEESELITIIKRGVLLIQNEEYKKAEQMLHIALKLAQEQQNYDGVTYIHDLLANLAYEQEEFDKAEKLFVSVMQRLLSRGISNADNKIIHISLKLANIYKIRQDYRKAEEGFKFCIKHLESSIENGRNDEDTMLLWAMTLDWYARFLVDVNRLSEAFAYFLKAYDLSVQLNGLENEETVVLLNDLGTICCIQNELDKALHYLKEAVAIGNKLSDMQDFSSVLVNLGMVYLKKGMVEEARQTYKEAWRNATQHNNQQALQEISSCLDELKNTQAG